MLLQPPERGATQRRLPVSIEHNDEHRQVGKSRSYGIGGVVSGVSHVSMKARAGLGYGGA